MSLRPRYCDCPRGRYEAHCAEQRLVPVCPPAPCGLCRYGVRYAPPVFDPKVAVPVDLRRVPRPRPVDADGNPILLALLVGDEPGGVHGVTEVSLAAPDGLTMAFRVNRALPQPLAVERVASAVAQYRSEGGAVAAFLMALFGTTCKVTCWRTTKGDDDRLMRGEATHGPVGRPWWTYEGSVGELLYGPKEDAS